MHFFNSQSIVTVLFTVSTILKSLSLIVIAKFVMAVLGSIVRIGSLYTFPKLFKVLPDVMIVSFSLGS